MAARSPRTFPTRHDLPNDNRRDLIALLNQHLADTQDLHSQTKYAHWNVKGPTFIALHKLFDELAAELIDAVDDIAERAVTLAGVAEGTAQVAVKNSTLQPYPVNLTDEKEHLKAVADRIAAFGKNVRAAIDASDEAGDKDTADLFTGVSRQIDKDLWFIEAHLQ